MDETMKDEDLELEATTEEVPLLEADDDASDKKSKKNRIRIEKHSRLMQYFEDKRLREDLDYIDNW